jgi:hypothetical protein
VLQRMRRWQEAATLLEGLAGIFQQRRARRPQLDERSVVTQILTLAVAELGGVVAERAVEKGTGETVDQDKDLRPLDPAPVTGRIPAIRPPSLNRRPGAPAVKEEVAAAGSDRFAADSDVSQGYAPAESDGSQGYV